MTTFPAWLQPPVIVSARANWDPSRTDWARVQVVTEGYGRLTCESESVFVQGEADLTFNVQPIGQEVAITSRGLLGANRVVLAVRSGHTLDSPKIGPLRPVTLPTVLPLRPLLRRVLDKSPHPAVPKTLGLTPTLPFGQLRPQFSFRRLNPPRTPEIMPNE